MSEVIVEESLVLLPGIFTCLDNVVVGTHGVDGYLNKRFKVVVNFPLVSRVGGLGFPLSLRLAGRPAIELSDGGEQ